MHPLRPLGVESTIGFLIFGFEHSNSLSLSIFDKITSAGSLIYSDWINSLVDGILSSSDQLCEPGII